MHWDIICFVIIWILFTVYCFWRICAHSDFVYKGLDDIWNRSKRIDITKEELLYLKNELINFHKNYCYVRHYGDYARKVLAYINGRLSV